MKTFSAYILYEEGVSQEVHDIHTIQHFEQSVQTISVEDYLKNHATIGNIIGLFGDSESLTIRKGKYKSIHFYN